MNEMSFSDDDLKWLKEDLSDNRYKIRHYIPNRGVLESLIARLEAAEAFEIAKAIRHLKDKPEGER